ncbi:glycine reductase [Rhodocyclus tenuis]|uniref:Glycine reductase n=2 Tax=Rhodocyclus TaxID=1064 RepID=A0A6L5JYW4_RHOTE|nr:glycine reductase [Rhodocyclus gracilis]MQY52379.1 glycine reductase [Rhodocyclus gracilis]NJA90213.1 glycine reductase [Rhodocyclus gracilis]
MSHHDAPIPYLARTRAWYLALGYDNPYLWARHNDAPFFALKKPLSASTVALITTAAPYRPELGEQGPGAPYNATAKFWQVYSGDSAADHDLRIAHVAIDRRHTTMTDSGTWFPLPRLRALAARGLLRLAPRFHGFPTNRSQRQTVDVDAPELLARCRADGVDAALLVANCPVCHQSLSLAARHLEAHGIATVVLGCARDVVEHCGVPRLLFSDFPLGNAAGRPHDPASQELTLLLALNLLAEAETPRTTWQSPLRWPGPADWKLDYANPERVTADELARLRDEAETARLSARALREATLGQEARPAVCSL